VAQSELKPWFEREFTFSFGVELHPELRARLRGTPARLEELTQDVVTEVLTARRADGWSIQENAGHLLDLEPLWALRLDEFLQGGDRLSAADLSNRRTHEAHHNDASMRTLLHAFRAARLAFVNRLDALPTEAFARVALHPRLQQPMRLADHLYFVAEHDDHHLARIHELLQARVT
jgi:uncharacterized damage-inducible protein DinB